MHEPDKLKQLGRRVDELESVVAELLRQQAPDLGLLLRTRTRPAFVTQAEVDRDLFYGQDSYDQPMAPETEKGQGTAA